ncbi:MAG TPA: transglutaminase domain-containing protein [Anaerolineae bacterium]|nr:transglutaminase domain-containing protein [Anaerolineae bacterium]
MLNPDKYGIGPTDLKQAGREPNQEINLRSTEEILEAAMALDDRPLTAPRAALQRVVGNCRDYALLLTAMLRHQGIPARVRSAAVPRKLGYVHEGTLRARAPDGEGGYRDSMIWTLLEDEYPASPATGAELAAYDVIGRKLL